MTYVNFFQIFAFQLNLTSGHSSMVNRLVFEDFDGIV